MPEYNGPESTGGYSAPQPPNYAYGGQQPPQPPNYAYGGQQPSQQTPYGGYSPTPQQGGYSPTQPLYGDPSQGGGYVPPQPPQPPQKKFPWLWIALSAVGLVVAVVLVVLLIGGDKPADTSIQSEPAVIEAAPTSVPAPEDSEFTTSSNPSGLTITAYHGGGGALVIPSSIDGAKVTAIGEYAFDGAAITEVTVPEGVSAIGNGAFSNCASLSEVIFPDSLQSVGDSVFAGSRSITRFSAGKYFDAYAPLFDTGAYISIASPDPVKVSLYYGESREISHSDFDYSVGGRDVVWSTSDEDVADTGAAGILATPWQWDVETGYYEAKVTGKVDNSDVILTYQVTVGDGVTYTQLWADNSTSFSTQSTAWTKLITPEVEGCYGIVYGVNNEVDYGEPFGVFWQFMIRENGKWSQCATMMIEANTDQIYDPIYFSVPKSFTEYTCIANVLRAHNWSGSVGYYISSLLKAPIS